jgi:DnaK suppressor protein
MVVRSYEQLRGVLEVERQRLKEAVAHHPEFEREVAGYGNHVADDATDVFEQAASVALLRKLKRDLQEVEAAILRLENGTYGRCQECGERIEWARLEARPQAPFCLRCQRRAESR